MRGSIHEIEIQQARASQIATHKTKLYNRQSLSNNSLLLASIGLNQRKTKRKQAAELAVKQT
jgi:hypothetical protein